MQSKQIKNNKDGKCDVLFSNRNEAETKLGNEQNHNRKCVIVGAAQIHNYKKIKRYFSKDDFFIFCDGGLNHQKKLGVKPNLIVGDFDSYNFRGLSPRKTNKFDRGQTSKIIKLPHEKDDTDSFFACKQGVQLGFSKFLLLGVVGGRFDHSLVNISILLYLQEHQKNALLIDDFSEMQLVEKNEILIPDSFSYFSLLCIDGDVSGVTIKNAKFPLENAEIKTSFQYACSNEVIKGKSASVSVQKGTLLLIKDF